VDARARSAPFRTGTARVRSDLLRRHGRTGLRASSG
jgi:hypothetical protein